MEKLFSSENPENKILDLIYQILKAQKVGWLDKQGLMRLFLKFPDSETLSESVLEVIQEIALSVFKGFMDRSDIKKLLRIGGVLKLKDDKEQKLISSKEVFLILGKFAKIIETSPDSEDVLSDYILERYLIFNRNLDEETKLKLNKAFLELQFFKMIHRNFNPNLLEKTVKYW